MTTSEWDAQWEKLRDARDRVIMLALQEASILYEQKGSGEQGESHNAIGDAFHDAIWDYWRESVVLSGIPVDED
jgi:hypothetical protein